MILITGPPGCGKTTLVRAVAGALDPSRVAGFITGEMREGGGLRTGFRVSLLHAPGDAVLARAEGPGPRIGRYGVDVEAFERLVLPFLESPLDPGKLHVLDEVGKMECLSARFRAAVERIFASGLPVLATVPLRAPGFPARIRSWPGARTFHLAPENRDEVRAEVLRLAAIATGA